MEAQNIFTGQIISETNNNNDYSNENTFFKYNPNKRRLSVPQNYEKYAHVIEKDSHNFLDKKRISVDLPKLRNF